MRRAWKRAILVLGVVAVAATTGTPANADPGTLWKNGQLGNDVLTPAEQLLTAEKVARSRLFDARLAAEKAGIADSEVGTQSCCYIYETVSVPTYEQLDPAWCGPATISEMLMAPRINKSVTQHTLASEMGTDANGTFMSNMRTALNNHTIYDPNVAPNMPSGWVWLIHEVTGVSDFVARHREDLAENLPSVFNVKGKSNDGTYSLVGWTYNGFHHMAGHGYREGDLTSDVLYTDSYEDPITQASLGSHWFDAYPMYILVRDNKKWIIY